MGNLVSMTEYAIRARDKLEQVRTVPSLTDPITVHLKAEPNLTFTLTVTGRDSTMTYGAVLRQEQNEYGEWIPYLHFVCPETELEQNVLTEILANLDDETTFQWKLIRRFRDDNGSVTVEERECPLLIGYSLLKNLSVL